MIENNRRQLVDNIRIAIAEKKDESEILSVAIELINNFSEGYNWTGFYMMRSNVLEVGPYIGPKTEHKKIDLNDGICGAAASEKKTIIVEDVNADPRFLACSVNTRSEIVVPLMDGDKCIGEIDIDSNQPGFFNHQDEEMLQEVASLIVNKLKGIK